jgi:leucyl aminopeptidase (aminopeptidase T)
MREEEKIKLFNDVFAPKEGENVLFLIDVPHNDIKDNKKWSERREMANEWYKTFKDLGNKENFTVKLLDYNATGAHNSPIPKNIIDEIQNQDLVIAMTEYSASSSLVQLCKKENPKIRCASMPLVEKRMEKTAFKADYKKVKKYAKAIKKMLDKSITAEVYFSTGDKLFIDLRNRKAMQESGTCSSPGDMINFPSGEAFKAPYEAAPDEIGKFGESRTKGILPIAYDTETIRYVVKNNKISKIPGKSKKAAEMRSFFNENKSRRNIAELGLGCNKKAVITGNLLEDEKVGLHIAYGMSSHIGGKVDCDMHLDTCYSKGCPIEGEKLTLTYEDGTKIDLIKNSHIRYELFD